MRPKIPEARTSPSKGLPFRPLKALEIPPHTLPPSCQLPPHTFYSFLSKNCMRRSDTPQEPHSCQPAINMNARLCLRPVLPAAASQGLS